MRSHKIRGSGDEIESNVDLSYSLSIAETLRSWARGNVLRQVRNDFGWCASHALRQRRVVSNAIIIRELQTRPKTSSLFACSSRANHSCYIIVHCFVILCKQKYQRLIKSKWNNQSNVTWMETVVLCRWRGETLKFGIKQADRAVFKWLPKNQNQSNYSDQSQQEQAARWTNHNS